MDVRTARPARLVHTSDVHLTRRGSFEERAFAATVDMALDVDADCLLVVGDLFDHARVDDDVLGWAADQLERFAGPVVLLNGNHDVLDERSVHHRFEVAHRCPNVSFLDDPAGSLVEVPGADLVVWGRAMVEHEPAYRPLVGVPERHHEAWHVAAGHGLVMESGAGGRSSPIYPEDLVLDWDYVALGHVHDHRVVSRCPLAVYPGATAGDRVLAPGAVVVDLDPVRGPTARREVLGI